MSLVATVIIPTSIDRGPCLRLAVESVLRQTVRELEVFIIGDGVAEITRETALDLVSTDSRVRFFDHPKHVRRGEPYRHEALREARGRIVCYLCDRDLYLPWHVEELSSLLADSDFAHTSVIQLQKKGFVANLGICNDLQNPANRKLLNLPNRILIPLSFGAHTLEAYRKLPEGWAITPADIYTDAWFWTKFGLQPSFRTVSGYRYSVIWMPRGAHPGLTTALRLSEMEKWSARIQNPDTLPQIEIEMNKAVRQFINKLNHENCNLKAELRRQCRPCRALWQQRGRWCNPAFVAAHR